MSAGAFVLTNYEDDNNTTRGIRVQPETLALVLSTTTNEAVTGSTDSYPSAQVSKGRRSIGVNARLVSIKFTGTPPTGYKADQIIRLPWLKQTTFGSLAIGATGTYLGANVVLVGKTGEKIR